MKFVAIAALFTVASGSLYAQNVDVKNAWVRASVQGQKATGAFMQLTASQPTTLVGVASPVAGVAEVHEMKMDGDVMRMRAVESLDLPKGQPVALKPGGYHLMLQQLKSPLLKDSTVPVTLVFKDSKGETSRLSLQVPVRTSAPGAAAGAAPAGGGHDGHGHGDGHAGHKH